MVIGILEESKAQKQADKLRWAVCYTIDHTAKGCQQDDKTDKIVTVATFSTPTHAQDFIDKCMPQETKERFFVVTIHNDYPKEIKYKYF